ncbi:MAG: M23 family metallopeptidase [Candidatus Nanopelagicales bacterium]
MLPLLLAAAALLVVPATPSAAASGPVAGTTRSSPAWVAPIEPPDLVAPFAPPPRRWLPGHRGVDLAAVAGDPVRAAGAGTVTWAGPLAGRGVVVISHDDGLRTTYEPVDATVVEGDRVQAGQVIGTVGEGDVHCGREPRCLHWGLRRGEDYLDPWRLLHPGRPVLLPP